MGDDGDSFVRSASLVAGLTLLSRVLGLVRDIACAAFFGAGVVWDAFSFAFRIPNLFRRLFGEGALSAAFVPVFSEHLELRGKEEAGKLTRRVAGALTVVLAAVVLFCEVVVLVALIGFDLNPRWQLTLLLTAVLLPYTFLVCLTAFAGATLHSLKHFAAPALAPVVLNVVWIVTVVGVAPALFATPQRRIFVVAGAILAGGVAQLLLQLAVLRRKGFTLRPLFDGAYGQIKRIAATMAPVALGMAAYQLNVVLDGVIAISLAGPPDAGPLQFAGFSLPYPLRVGANSVLYYANRVMQAPLGVFGIALATAAFPTLSRQAARRDWTGFSRSVLRGLRLVVFIGLPAGVGMMLARRPLIGLLFQRGAFTPEMAARTARALLCYSAGIWAYCGLHVLTRAFYSLKRPGVPAAVAGGMVVLNLAANLMLVWPMAEAGLATSTAACAAIQVFLLGFLLRREVPLRGLSGLARTTGKTALATATMAAGTSWVLRSLSGRGDLAQLLGGVAAGGLIFVASAAVLRMEELHSLLRAIGRSEPRP
ncbi:MAG: murein biosynthesis integral membrane protein MurJ [Candidatus Brocadiia bacterium]